MSASYSAYTDHELLLFLKEGDQQAFTEIYNRYWERLFFIAHKRLSVLEDSKEIVQNIFLTIWEKRIELTIDNLSFYLAAMTRYAVYRHLANENRRETKLRSLHANSQNYCAKAFDLDNKQLLEFMTRFANQLPEKYRILFIHHKLLDKPLAEVAEQLGVSTRTAEAYVTKLMSIMRQHRAKLASFLLFI